MPVRAIKRIELGLEGSNPGELALRVPEAIVHSIRLMPGDIFVCEFKAHFNSERKLIREINESVEVRCRHRYFSWDEYESSYYLHSPHIIILTDLDVMKKYGFLVDEYLEISFKEVKKGEKSIPLFLERTIEDLDFVPVEK
jgi:hypothetical protein